MPSHLIDENDLSDADIAHLCAEARLYRESPHSRHFASPRRVGLVFTEHSTRTRVSFEMACHRLGADAIVIHGDSSSLMKGESLFDMLQNLQAMGMDALVVRVTEEGALRDCAASLTIPLINAGEGRYAHPTQALQDTCLIESTKGPLAKLTIALCGDVMHSRVARSNVRLWRRLGATIRLVGPPSSLPDEPLFEAIPRYHNMDEGIKDADTVMMLRLQRERMTTAVDEAAFIRDYQLTPARLMAYAPNAIVMHPGPVNYGVEMSASMRDHPASYVLEQVRYGVAMRQAVLAHYMQGVL